jgi:hypothetical protein
MRPDAALIGTWTAEDTVMRFGASGDWHYLGKGSFRLHGTYEEDNGIVLMLGTCLEQEGRRSKGKRAPAEIGVVAQVTHVSADQISLIDLDNAIWPETFTRTSVKYAKANPVILEIYAAFKDVSREGGVSWREALIMDAHGDESPVSYRDRDEHWHDLIWDRSWDSDMGTAPWAFLDALSFRYYLPAAMVRTARGDSDTMLYELLRLRGGDQRVDPPNVGHAGFAPATLHRRLCAAYGGGA